MIAFNYAGAIFLITFATFVMMSLITGKDYAYTFSYGIVLSVILSMLTLIGSVLFYRKEKTKVFELEDEASDKK
ncbi:MAG: hypothetical protein HQK84_02495 [Nitrospinae bacterium]|nr:hypothetical protein [Nitrospinota bacterium]